MGRQGTSTRPEEGSPRALSKPQILVVEDSQQQREAILKQLANLEYATQAAEDCGEARDLAEDNTFACALIDVGLPDGKGTDLLVELLSNDPHMVPIILTGYDDSNTVIDAMRGGAFDYLVKPVDLMTLTTSLSRAVAHHNLLCERDTLVGLLRDERDQLKSNVEAATNDLRAYAKSCEASNALLDTLVRLTQLSVKFHTDEDLFRTVFSEMSTHIPLLCVAFCDTTHGEFWAAVHGEEASEIDVIVSSGEHADGGLEMKLSVDDPELLTRYWVQRHTGIDTNSVQRILYPQALWNLPSCTVGFYLEKDFPVGDSEREFMSMCAYFVGYEWQRARLLLHAAHNASLGNIALEMVKSFLQSLTAIRTATDFIEETIDAPDAIKGLSIISENVDYMTGQTQVFHDLSQIRQDSIETVQIDEYLNSTLELLSKAIEQRGVSIEKDFQTSSQCVLLNGTALARTFLDLLSSAIRTVDEGGKILLRIRAKGEDHVQCEIIHHLMTSDLYDSSHSDENRFAGPVEGHPSFMLARRTVNSCGGKLVVERDENTRNTFRLILPRNALQSPPVQEPIR